MALTVTFVKPDGSVTGPLPLSEKDHYLDKGFRIWTGSKPVFGEALSDLDRCVATTQVGKRCKKEALPSSPFCYLHHNQHRKD